MAETSTHAGFFTWTREAQIALQPDGTVIAWNPAAARLLQIPADAAIGQALSDLLPDIADLLRPGQEAAAATAPDWQRRTLTLMDGGELVVEAAATWHDGRLLLILAESSVQAAAERASHEIEQHYRSMLDALPIGFTVVSLRDERYPTLYQNNWGIEVSGWGNDEWERDPDFSLQILHPDDRERMLAFRDEFRQSLGPFDVEYRVVRPDDHGSAGHGPARIRATPRAAKTGGPGNPHPRGAGDAGRARSHARYPPPGGRRVPPVQADGDLLTQLVTNMVTNAIKYTPAGGLIGIDVARAGADAVEIAVTDSGPGIPPDALETIFRRFARLARDERQQIVGSGLGLPITRQIAELHGGRIWAESIAGGARFVVQLPIAGPTIPSD